MPELTLMLLSGLCSQSPLTLLPFHPLMGISHWGGSVPGAVGKGLLPSAERDPCCPGAHRVLRRQHGDTKKFNKVLSTHPGFWELGEKL